MIIEAGTKVRLHHETLDTGQFSILPVNNYGVSGNGIINVTIFFVNETVPPGTFPVAIPTQTVQAKVSSVQTLSNEGSSVGTEVIDIGTTGNPKLVDIFNDHFTLSIEISGVKHTILQGSLTGNPTKIGSAADISEVLGTLFLDSIISAANNVGYAIRNAAGVNHTALTDDASDIVHLIASNGNQINLDTSTTNIAQILNSGLLLPNNIPLQSKDAGGTIRSLLLEDGSNNVVFNAGNQNLYNINNNNNTKRVGIDTGDVNPLLDLSAAVAKALKLVVGTITRISVFTGTATSAGVLQAHGLGVTPDWVGLTQTNTAGDVNSFQWDKVNSNATNIKVWSNNATARAYIAVAIAL